jgi:hypothetical protein
MVYLCRVITYNFERNALLSVSTFIKIQYLAQRGTVGYKPEGRGIDFR